MEKSKSDNGARAVIRKWLPWIVTTAIFVYLFKRIPVDEVLEAAVRVDLPAFLALIIFGLFFHFFWDILVYAYTFNLFGTSVTYRGMMWIRGATYLLSLLNYMVGQGGFSLIMNRWKEISISRATSVVLFCIMIDYYVLLALCLAGAFSLPGVDINQLFVISDEGHLVRFIVISWALFAVHIGFYRRLLPRSKGFEWVKQNEVLASFREAPVIRYVKLILLRSVSSLVGIVVTYYALGTFGIHVPLLELSVMLPLVWLIGAIPITVMGMGTVQAAMILFVAGYAQGVGNPQDMEAAVLAYSLLSSLLHRLGLFIIGAFCIARVPRSLWAPKNDGNIYQPALD